jgi:hypothetical protein
MYFVECVSVSLWLLSVHTLNHISRGELSTLEGVANCGPESSGLRRWTEHWTVHPVPIPNGVHCRFSRLVKTRLFLDHLIAARRGNKIFTETLTPEFLLFDSGHLNSFLGDHVYFKKIVFVSSKLTYSKLVKCWNWGAAIMCRNNCISVDTNRIFPAALQLTWEFCCAEQTNDCVELGDLPSNSYEDCDKK